MKYSISSRQEKKYIEAADEIIVNYRDRDIIFDYVEKYPEKTVILKIPRETEVDYDMIKSFATKIDLICCLEDIYMYPNLKNLDIKYYYAYPVTSYFELQGLKNIGVCYIMIGMPLFFDLPTVKKFDIPVRAVPNVAFEPYIPQENGICGQWIRPEDVEVYEEYIDAFEFRTTSLPQERALYRIYAEQHRWPGEMSDIITNFGVEATNPVVFDDIAKIRTTCKQKCQAGSPCRLCERSVKFGDVVRKYAELKKESISD